jgi:energy coupling factor transporter S component ThiW
MKIRLIKLAKGGFLQMNFTKKITTTSMLAGFAVLSSSFIYLPVGFTKVFPIQHLINVIAAVMLGPAYAVAQAFIVSLLRNMLGTGSIFAFPGSMIGALVAGLLFQKTKQIRFACLGEWIGTGILGSLACYPIAILFLGEKVALFGFLPSFLASSFTGSLLAFFILKGLLKNRYMEGKLYENSTHHRRL